jgi:tetratricopeptide (TPR) repeat protein
MARVRVRDPLRLRFLDWVRRWPHALRRRMEIGAVAVLGLIVLIVAFRQPMSDRLYPEAQYQQTLDAAARALQAGKLTSPDGTGARELYASALAMDSDRDEARAGLQRVGEVALAKADKATDARRFQEAHLALRLARELAVPSAQVDRIEERLRQHEVDIVAIDTLLSDAAAARQAGHLDGDAKAALPLYKQVLSLQPSNNTALEGREDTLSQLLQQAQAHLEKGEFEEAGALVARVREFDPGHVGLPDAQAALTQARDKQRARGDTALRGKQLDAATDAYRSALALDPNDAQARDNLTRLAAAWAQRSQRAASDFDFDEARRALDLARMIDPKSPAIAEAERHLAQSRARGERLPGRASSPGRIAEVRRLLAGAAESEARGDLLTPPGDSAYDQIRRARALAPDDPSVRAAQARLLPAARTCFDDALRSNRLVRAEGCLDAREQLGDSRAGVLEARNRLAMRWIAVGQERLGAGEITTAQRALTSARALDPNAEGLDAFAERLRLASRR